MFQLITSNHRIKFAKTYRSDFDCIICDKRLPHYLNRKVIFSTNETKIFLFNDLTSKHESPIHDFKLVI